MNVNRIAGITSVVIYLEADGQTCWFEWLPTKEGAERVVRHAQSLVERELMGTPTFCCVCREVNSVMAVTWKANQRGER